MKATRMKLMKTSSRDQALMRRTREATKATPAESPSMLSSRLKALVIPTIQTRVTTTFIHWKGRNVVVTPARTRMTAASTCPTALTQTGNRSPHTSSARPTPKARVEPRITAKSLPPTL